MVATVAPLYEEEQGGAAMLPELIVEPMMPSIVAVSSLPSPLSSPSPSPQQPPPLGEHANPIYTEQTPQVIAMRPMDLDDIDQVRELHEQWFPIRYQQSFYEGAAQGIWRETGFPLFTRLAAETPQQAAAAAAQYQATTSATYGYTEWSPRAPTIYGAVMASTIPLTSVEDQGLLASDDYTHTHAMYILTLGSRAAMRRRGLASGLLAECIEEARRQPRCGAVYLHVKADNVSALRFYEKNGFQNLRFLEDYYVIDGVRHSAYLYILHVNGAAAPNGWLTMFTKPLFALFSMASHTLKKLLDGFLDDSYDTTTTTTNRHSGATTNKDHQQSARRKQPPPFVDDEVQVAMMNHVHHSASSFSSSMRSPPQVQAQAASSGAPPLVISVV